MKIMEQSLNINREKRLKTYAARRYRDAKGKLLLQDNAPSHSSHIVGISLKSMY